MANVAGVSQLLETVGVPAAQTSSPTTVGQTFATAMRQANTDAGVTEEPSPASPKMSQPQVVNEPQTPQQPSDKAAAGASPSPAQLVAALPSGKSVPPPSPSTPRYTSANMLAELLGRAGSATLSKPASAGSSTATPVAPAKSSVVEPVYPGVPEPPMLQAGVRAETTAAPSGQSVAPTQPVAPTVVVRSPSPFAAAPLLETNDKEKAAPAAPIMSGHATPVSATNSAKEPPPISVSAQAAALITSTAGLAMPPAMVEAASTNAATAATAAITAAAAAPLAFTTGGKLPFPVVAAASPVAPKTAAVAPMGGKATPASLSGSTSSTSVSSPAPALPSATLAAVNFLPPQTDAVGGPAHVLAANTPLMATGVAALAPQQSASGGKSGTAVATGARLTAQPLTSIESGQTQVAAEPSMSGPMAMATTPVVKADAQTLLPAEQVAQPTAAPPSKPAAKPGVVPVSVAASPATPVSAAQSKNAASDVKETPYTAGLAPAAAPTFQQPSAPSEGSSGVVAVAPVVHTPIAISVLGNPNGPAQATSNLAAAAGTGATPADTLPHTTLSSTPTSLEVGVSSGTHGWLKVRAELNASGTVDASLTGANAAATGKLRGDLPALSSFLQDEKVMLGSLNVGAPSGTVSPLHTVAASTIEAASAFTRSAAEGVGATGTAVASDAGTAAGGRAPHQQAQADAPVLSATREDDGSPAATSIASGFYGEANDLGGGILPQAAYGGGGSWLNVRV